LQKKSREPQTRKLHQTPIIIGYIHKKLNTIKNLPFWLVKVNNNYKTMDFPFNKNCFTLLNKSKIYPIEFPNSNTSQSKNKNNHANDNLPKVQWVKIFSWSNNKLLTTTNSNSMTKIPSSLIFNKNYQRSKQLTIN
jgi:hypothetical protein